MVDPFNHDSEIRLTREVIHLKKKILFLQQTTYFVKYILDWILKGQLSAHHLDEEGPVDNIHFTN